MAPRKRWGFDPNSGGQKIPESVKRDVENRIRRVAEEHFEGQYTRLDIRFKGQFCYIDAFAEPQVTEGWPPKDWPETREEYIERLRNTPTHLCRLRYFGQDEWGFAFYAYSSANCPFILMASFSEHPRMRSWPHQYTWRKGFFITYSSPSICYSHGDFDALV